MKNKIVSVKGKLRGALAGSVLMVSCTNQGEERVEGRPGSPVGSARPAPASARSAEPAQEVSDVEAENGPARGQITPMDIGTLFQLREEERVFLVDVRPGFFHALNHIPGSISMPLKKLEDQLPGFRPQFEAALADGKGIVLYCTDENCPDGLRAASRLAELGYSTSVYKGGWKEWKASGL